MPDTGYSDTEELIVEFRADGKLLYGTQKSEGGLLSVRAVCTKGVYVDF